MSAWRRGTVMLLAIVLVACNSDAAGPDSVPLELPAHWSFDGGNLDGWTLGSRSTGTGGGSAARNNAGGYVEMTAWGQVGVPDAWMSLQVALPDVVGLWIDARSIGGCVEGEDRDSEMRIRVTRANGTSSLVHDWRQVDDFEWPGMLLGGSLEQFAGETVTITIEQDDEGEQEESASDAESVCVDNVDIFID